jgi:secreted trypsin-like serine protease
MYTNMSNEYTEKQQRELINKAIKHAESEAGNDDVSFVKKLRAKYFQLSEATGDAPRTMAGTLIPADDGLFSAYADPRGAANARQLAIDKNRIVGGSPVLDKEFHDCVAILCGGQGAQWDSACTGTLIAKNIVVTAGHCQCQMNASRVFVGNDITGEGKTVKVAKQVRHPKYHTANIHNDLMVLVLESEIIEVPPRKIAPSEMIDGAKFARAVGFGTIDATGTFGYGKKRQVDLPIVSNSCQAKANGMDDQKAFQCDPGLELVAGKPLLEKDTCSGDSGGPLYVTDGQGGLLLAGATSRGTPNSPHNCGDGGVYVRVDRYLDWIHSIANI